LNYGHALAEGYDGKINLREAMIYYKKLTDLRDSEGMLNQRNALQKIYCQDQSSKAMKYDKSAQLRHSEGMLNQ
jgi:hypothetical protein